MLEKTNRFSLSLLFTIQPITVIMLEVIALHEHVIAIRWPVFGEFVIKKETHMQSPAVASVANHSDLSKLRFGQLTMLKTEIN